MDHYQLNQAGADLLSERRFSLMDFPLAKEKFLNEYGEQSLLNGDRSLQGSYCPIFIMLTHGILAIYYQRVRIGILCSDSMTGISF